MWKDALRNFNKDEFDPTKKLHVHFIGEEAADEGGPRREFLHLLMQEILTSTQLFEGDEKRKVVTMNPVLLDAQTYFQAGRMVAVSIQQGGPGMQCLAPSMYHTIVEKRSLSNPTPDEIPDFEIQGKVKTVSLMITYFAEKFKECGFTEFPYLL